MKNIKNLLGLYVICKMSIVEVRDMQTRHGTNRGGGHLKRHCSGQPQKGHNHS